VVDWVVTLDDPPGGFFAFCLLGVVLAVRVGSVTTRDPGDDEGAAQVTP
jgi:hypothetical protein